MDYQDKKFKFPKNKNDLKDFFEEITNPDNIINKLDNFIEFDRIIKNYSLRNKKLIFAQTSGKATLVKPFSEWKKENIQINKGEKALFIYAPTKIALYKVNNEWKALKKSVMYTKDTKYEKKEKVIFRPVARVFDISQTNAGEEYHKKIIDEKVKVEEKEVYDSLIKILKKENINLKISNNLIGELGQAKSNKNLILNSDISSNDTLRVIVHELLHHKKHFTDEKITKNQEEVEAETVAYFISKKLGIETGNSEQYIQKYLKGLSPKEFDNTLDRTFDFTNEILDEIKSEMNNEKKLKGKELSEKIKKTRSNSVKKRVKNNNDEISL